MLMPWTIALIGDGAIHANSRHRMLDRRVCHQRTLARRGMRPRHTTGIGISRTSREPRTTRLIVIDGGIGFDPAPARTALPIPRGRRGEAPPHHRGTDAEVTRSFARAACARRAEQHGCRTRRRSRGGSSRPRRRPGRDQDEAPCPPSQATRSSSSTRVMSPLGSQSIRPVSLKLSTMRSLPPGTHSLRVTNSCFCMCTE